MDNAPDNNTTLVEVARILNFNNSWPEENRMRYLGYIIDLVVNALLFGTSLSKL